ncbi:GNAT family N-acetyltransferase [Nonomuraea sediminis]|uniref:GNAT family N-acetyltransferase n=1 Tax=Nonomuraea sediminis TaxID=2835864 RepID=UPI001BDBC1CB|nr:GNAT family N-acetyltransferase [Nonomuraea sediminis]
MIRSADKDQDTVELGEVLARAFHDDPVILWMLPGGKGSALMFATLARYQHALADLAYRDDVMAGAALWDPPGHEGDMEGAIPGFVEAMGDRVSHGMLLEEALAAHRPKEPHWYLAQIGVVPEAQGSGVGGELMRAGLARVDAEGLAAYLESSKESNVPIYEHYGFTVTERVDLPDGPPMWGMWRPSKR